MATTDLVFSEHIDENGRAYWMAEATANGDYGVHIERADKGTFRICQRFTDSGEYAESDAPYHLTDVRKVIEMVMYHGIYPIHLRFISYTPVVSGVLKETE